MCELHLTSSNVCKVHAKGNTLPRFLETFPVSVASTSRFLWFCFSLLFLPPLFQPIRFKADWTLIYLVGLMTLERKAVGLLPSLVAINLNSLPISVKGSIIKYFRNFT